MWTKKDFEKKEIEDTDIVYYQASNAKHTAIIRLYPTSGAVDLYPKDGGPSEIKGKFNLDIIDSMPIEFKTEKDAWEVALEAANRLTEENNA